jgi:predicted dehydrogenase
MVATSSWRRSRAGDANDQIGIGIVGCGIRGTQHLHAFAKVPNVRIVGLCDPDRKRLSEAAVFAPGAQQWTDLRAMFESPDVDAVVIATCNHWHALAAVWALEAGKHVYVEKPLTLTHWESRQLVKATQVFNRIVQVGTQQRSDPMQDELKAFLHEDAVLGKIQWVLVNRFGERGPIGLRKTPLKPPTWINYDVWLGPAADVPIYRKSLHYDWHWVWNTGSGEMGNWVVHVLDDVRNVVFRDRVGLPSKVVATGDRVAWHDAGETPNLQFVVAEAAETPVVISLCNLSLQEAGKTSPVNPGPSTGYVVFCEDGRLEAQRGQAVAFDRSGAIIREFTGNTGEFPHHQNFIDALERQDRSILKAPVEVGHFSTAWCNFANIATNMRRTGATTIFQKVVDEFRSPAAIDTYEHLQLIFRQYDKDPAGFQLGPMLACDVASERFVGEHSSQANEMLQRVYRRGYALRDYTADS